MTAILIWVALGALLVFGAYGKFHSQWTAEGRASCQAEFKAADDKLAAKVAELRVESENHIADMVTAFEQGEKEKAPMVITRVVKAQADARTAGFPVCALPAAALVNLNAARLSMRRETVPPEPPTGAPSAPAPSALPLMTPAAPASPNGLRQPLSKAGK